MKHAVMADGAGFMGSQVVDHILQEGGWHGTVLDNYGPFCPRESEVFFLPNTKATLPSASSKVTSVTRNTSNGATTNPSASWATSLPQAACAAASETPRATKTTNSAAPKRSPKPQEDGEPNRSSTPAAASTAPTPAPRSEDGCVLQAFSPSAGAIATGELLGHMCSCFDGIRSITLC